MQPVRLNIPGEFWDSQIYRGRLYLFGRDGSILTYDWDALVDSLSDAKSHRLAIACAFKNSGYLYGHQWDLVFDDPDIRYVITKKFASLAAEEMECSPRRLRRFLLGEQDNPFPTFPHADSVIYGQQLFVIGQKGVYVGSCHKRNKYPISTRPKRRWDCPAHAGAALYGTLALATGSEGLWRMPIGAMGSEFYDDSLMSLMGEPLNLSKRHCDDCEWMYHSVYGSSYSEGGFLASFKEEHHEASNEAERAKRWFYDKDIDDESIFEETVTNQYSWGARDKVYAGSGGQLSVVKYSPWERVSDVGPLEGLGKYDLKKQDEIVSGGVACFGTIVEYDNALQVLLSSGATTVLRGEPVNWRVFPNSRNYQNHLHVTYEDHLAIFSFNQDYFVDQDQKIFGIRPLLQKSSTSRLSDRLI